MHGRFAMWPLTWWCPTRSRSLRSWSPSSLPVAASVGPTWPRRPKRRSAHLLTLVADIRRFADSRAKPPGFGSEAPLSEVLVHGQDIRIPLGLDDTSAIESWAAILDFLVMPKARRGFVSRSLQGFQFVASDVDWAHGTGDEVRGPAMALALAMMGRKARVEDLTGPGAPRLAGTDLS